MFTDLLIILYRSRREKKKRKLLSTEFLESFLNSIPETNDLPSRTIPSLPPLPWLLRDNGEDYNTRNMFSNQPNVFNFDELMIRTLNDAD